MSSATTIQTSPTQDESVRTLIVREIFEVEKSYVGSLQLLVNVSNTQKDALNKLIPRFQKYLTTLKKPENAHVIDDSLLDIIFFQVVYDIIFHNGIIKNIR